MDNDVSAQQTGSVTDRSRHRFFRLSWVFVGIVITSLLALLVLPFSIGRDTSRLQREISDGIEPARTALTEIEFAQARQVAAVRGFALTHETRFANRYTAALAQERRAFSVLEPLVRGLDAGARDAFDNLRAAADAWRAGNTWVVDGHLAGDSIVAGLARRERLYEETLASAAALERHFATLEEARRARITNLENVQKYVSVALVLLVLGSVLIVFWLGRELEMRRAMAERERREKTSMLESTGEGIYVIDLDGRCTYINPAGARLLGYAPDALLGRNMHEAVHHSRPDGTPFPERECPAHNAYRQGHEARTDDDVLWRSDDSPLAVESAAAPIVEDGRITGAVVVFSDVTQRKQIERERTELLHREREARRAAETAESWSGYLARAGEVLSATLDYQTTTRSVAQLAVPQLADWCVLDLEGGPGRPRRVAIAHNDPDHYELLRALAGRYPPADEGDNRIAAVARTGQPAFMPEVDDAALRDLAPDADAVALLRELGTASAMVLPLGSRTGVMGAIALVRTDPRRRYSPADVERAGELARRGALAIENSSLYEATEQAVHTRDEVLAVVSHDLRNPLNTIVMAVELLEDRITAESSDDADRMRRQVSIVRRSVDQASRLIGDLLDVGRIERGRLTVAPEECDVGRLIRDVVELHQPMAAEHGIELVRDLDDDLPPVLADRERAVQVFSNLIGNALKFTSEGGSIRVSAHAADGVVDFEVADTGVGIPEEDLPNLFAPFWQGRHADRFGAGLGLAICRGIIEAHGGAIIAESVEGHGTTIRFTLPAVDGRPPAA